MTQRIESDRFPYLPIELILKGNAMTFDALLDTGFDGYLAIPPEHFRFEVTPDGFQQWILADGSMHGVPVYAGVVRVGNFVALPARVIVLGSEVIVGRRITDRYSVTLDHGRRVVVEP